MQAPRAVLVTRFSSIGDIVLVAPAISALAQAWPSTRIIFATKAPFAPLLAAHPDIDAIASCQPHWSWRRLQKELAAHRPDALCDLHGKARGVILRLGLQTRRCAVWRKRDLDQTLSMYFGHGRYVARKQIAARYHTAVEALVGRALPRVPLRFYVAAADGQAAAELLDRCAPQSAGPRIGVSFAALWATKRWPLDRFVQLARRLVNAGMQVILLGGPQEKAQADAAAQQVPGACNLTGMLDLGRLGGVIGACDVFVANDSGPMHIARALGVPTLAFFGSTDPKQFQADGHRLLFSARDCAPCSFHGYAQCPRGHLGCLLDFDVEFAYAQVQALLGSKPVAAVFG